ncbi:MAG: SMI1/KNR4 family protein [Planctomycetes bacterium]|nr:SMI1/KNR4 family protein [Planctomycetota bacterium]
MREYYSHHNGLILFGGALHMRGLVQIPVWHSLFEAWSGERALYCGYKSLTTMDIPFAQDCVGDQFLLRDGKVVRLYAETDEVEPLELDLDTFFSLAVEDPDGFLSVEPLRQLQAQGGEIEPGELVSVFPPYVLKHDAEYSFRAVSVADRLSFLADLARQIRELPDGQEVRIRLTE